LHLVFYLFWFGIQIKIWKIEKCRPFILF
jgi:hypothetical protein